MAARRVTKSSVNWTALAGKVPSGQKEAFRVLKSHTDKYVSKVADLPEALPKIDFAEYRRRITDKTLVAEFEKMYGAVEVPYPKDPSNHKAKIQSEEKVALQQRDTYLAERNLHLKGLKDILATVDSIPPPEKMTMQMYNHYFPDAAINPNRANPGYLPHKPQFQPDQEEFGDTYLNTSRNSRNIRTVEEWEELERIHFEHQKAERARQITEKKSKE